jgi:hypothetical protein
MARVARVGHALPLAGTVGVAPLNQPPFVLFTIVPFGRISAEAEEMIDIRNLSDYHKSC